MLRIAFKTFIFTQIFQGLSQILCPNDITAVIAISSDLNHSQRLLPSRLGGVLLLILAILMAAFGLYPLNNQTRRTALWIFIAHNLLSFVLIFDSRLRVSDQEAWKDGNVIHGGLHLMWLLIAITSAVETRRQTKSLDFESEDVK
jgi:hypothetical protein